MLYVFMIFSFVLVVFVLFEISVLVWFMCLFGGVVMFVMKLMIGFFMLFLIYLVVLVLFGLLILLIIMIVFVFGLLLNIFIMLMCFRLLIGLLLILIVDDWLRFRVVSCVMVLYVSVFECDMMLMWFLWWM